MPSVFFVNDHVNAQMIDTLHEMGVKALLLRSAGGQNHGHPGCERK